MDGVPSQERDCQLSLAYKTGSQHAPLGGGIYREVCFLGSNLRIKIAVAYYLSKSVFVFQDFLCSISFKDSYMEVIHQSQQLPVLDYTSLLQWFPFFFFSL